MIQKKIPGAKVYHDVAAKTAAGYVNSMCVITEKIEEKET